MTNRPGDVLAGRYRLVDLLSESGAGRFWRAHDLVLERDVALHVIAEDDPRAPVLLDAARRSALVLDPHILRVLDADARDGLCYVVNEWGSGTSLDIMVAAGGPLGARTSAYLVGQVAAAIAVAHGAGVAHGRLNPESVLVDRAGAVRVIGLCVDAALHGAPAGGPAADVTDLAGLLYTALTARWGGRSTSAVARAPQEHGRVLRPRQVRAGVPRTLDQICDELLNPYAARERDPRALDTARGLADTLADFVGDPTGLPEALLARQVSRGDETVTFSAVPEFGVRDGTGEQDAVPPPRPVEVPVPLLGTAAVAEADDEPAARPEPPAEPPADPPTDPATDPAAGAEPDPAPSAPAPEVPTEAGLPIFDDDGGVSWMGAPGAPAPPPPPFEDPPERPLFAPEPADGGPVRRPRPSAIAAAAADPSDFWPWDHTGTGTGVPVIGAPVAEEVPGRNWLRIAGGLIVALLLLVLVVVVVNLSRGRTVLGADDGGSTPSDRASSSTGADTGPARTLTGLTVRDFDPQGDPPAEYPETVGLVIDGDPATGWRTSTYTQQFGPGGLKTGVGVVIDLGASRTVEEVDLQLTGQPTGVSLYLTDQDPRGIGDLTPVATADAGTRATLTPTESPTGAVTGRYVIVWLTSLPAVRDGFRGQIDEVVVRGS